MKAPSVKSQPPRYRPHYFNTVARCRPDPPLRWFSLLLALVPRILAGQIPQVAVERQLARELNLSVGDTVRLGPTPDSATTLVVVGAVYEPRPDPAEIAKRERHLRMHLPDLAALLGTPDRVDRFGVALAPGVSPDTAVAQLNRGAFGYRAYASGTIAAESSQTFLVVSRFHLLSASRPG